MGVVKKKREQLKKYSNIICLGIITYNLYLVFLYHNNYGQYLS
jgi:multisubunit Na+/H+ antiporter MnhB subunit